VSGAGRSDGRLHLLPEVLVLSELKRDMADVERRLDDLRGHL
jgi:hypothetical protein